MTKIADPLTVVVANAVALILTEVAWIELFKPVLVAVGEIVRLSGAVPCADVSARPSVLKALLPTDWAALTSNDGQYSTKNREIHRIYETYSD